MDHIPHTKYLETPLYILATAGMRLLPESKREAILDNLRENIPKMSHFHFVDSQLEVISGKQEGIAFFIKFFTGYNLCKYIIKKVTNLASIVLIDIIIPFLNCLERLKRETRSIFNVLLTL